MPEINFDYLINRSLKLLSYRPRSTQEIIWRLKKTGVASFMITRVINHLTDQGLLNDLEFSRWWVDQRIKFRPRGNIALTQELSRKGISRDIIGQVLLSFDQELKLAQKLPPQKRLSRGFSQSIIDSLRSVE